jgi:hypothetical protein
MASRQAGFWHKTGNSGKSYKQLLEQWTRLHFSVSFVLLNIRGASLPA